MVDKKLLEELKRLSPKDRLRKIEDLKKQEEKKRKKTEADMQSAIAASIKEMELDKMLEEIEVPKTQDVKVEELFEKDTDVEEIVLAEKIKIDQGGENYAARMDAIVPRDTINQWYTQDNAPPSQDEFLEIYDQVKEQYEQVKDQLPQPGQDYKTGAEETAENIVASMYLMRKMGHKHGFF
ncbi:hypothetical protein ACFL0V_04245 [Nanoarchaeota archaeon]